MVRCIDCHYMHQQDRTKDHYFCLETRDYIYHEIDKDITCEKHRAKIINKYRY